MLHHLADPMRGWSRLVRLAQAGRLMRLGFYSELGRADVAAGAGVCRGAAATKRPRTTSAAAGRIFLKAASRACTRSPLSPDFYSTSACRDLLFHVQEHRLTLPQIGAFLTEHRLTFLGFELPTTDACAIPRASFPDDAAMTDLAHWHRSRADNPDTFGGMYRVLGAEGRAAGRAP